MKTQKDYFVAVENTVDFGDKHYKIIDDNRIAFKVPVGGKDKSTVLKQVEEYKNSIGFENGKVFIKNSK